MDKFGSTVFQVVLLSLLCSGCFLLPGSQTTSNDSSKVDATEDTKTVESSAEDGSQGAKVEVPVGTLGIDTITLEEGADLNTAEIKDALGLGAETTAASSSVHLGVAEGEDLSQVGQLKIFIPIEEPVAAGLVDAYELLVIIYHVQKPDGTFVFGLIIRSDIEITDGLASFKALGVGSYQAVYLTIKIDNTKEIVAPEKPKTKKEAGADTGTTSTTAAATKSSITGTSSIVANGTDKSTVTVTLKGEAGDPVVGVVPKIGITGTGNSVSQNCSGTNANGVSTCAAAISSTKAESKTLKVMEPIGFSGGVISFVAGSAAQANSSVTAARDIAGDAHDTTNFTVILKDAHNNAVSGVTPVVGVESGGLAVVKSNCPPTNGSGTSVCPAVAKSNQIGELTPKLTSPFVKTGPSFKVIPFKGNKVRACGFDMNDNDIIGEPEDCNVCDGVTTDVDGDGQDEDLFYIDATGGTNAGSNTCTDPLNPCATINYAMTQNGTAEEDIFCLRGNFSLASPLSVSSSGLATEHTAPDGTKYPLNPAMIVGWDYDNDGQYPPYDDEATLDVSGLSPSSAVIDLSTNSVNHFELAHLKIVNQTDGIGIDAGAATNDVVHIHDVEFAQFNVGANFVASKQVLVAGGSNMVFENNLINEAGSSLISVKNDGAEDHIYRNNSALFKGGNNQTQYGIRLEPDEITNISISRNKFDGNIANSVGGGSGNYYAIFIQNKVQNVSIQGNDLRDSKNCLKLVPNSGAATNRPIDNITFDGNLCTVKAYTSGASAIVSPTGGSVAGKRLDNLIVTNNLIVSESTGVWTHGLNLDMSNTASAHAGAVVISGNTFDLGAGLYGISLSGVGGNRQDDFTIMNNIVTGITGTNYYVYFGHTFSNVTMNGNIYSPDGSTPRWFYGVPKATFADWQAVSAITPDGNGAVCDPAFKNTSLLNYRLAATDTCAKDNGQDISGTVAKDYDDKPRSSVSPDAGAFEGI